MCDHLARLPSYADWQAQMGIVRRWYQPHLERIYDHAHVRAQDLDQLEQIAAHYPSREPFLSALTLHPPESERLTTDLDRPT